jgi:hypothetical protein
LPEKKADLPGRRSRSTCHWLKNVSGSEPRPSVISTSSRKPLRPRNGIFAALATSA